MLGQGGVGLRTEGVNQHGRLVTIPGAALPALCPHQTYTHPPNPRACRWKPRKEGYGNVNFVIPRCGARQLWLTRGKGLQPSSQLGARGALAGGSNTRALACLASRFSPCAPTKKAGTCRQPPAASARPFHSAPPARRSPPHSLAAGPSGSMPQASRDSTAPSWWSRNRSRCASSSEPLLLAVPSFARQVLPWGNIRAPRARRGLPVHHRIVGSSLGATRLRVSPCCPAAAPATARACGRASRLPLQRKGRADGQPPCPLCAPAGPWRMTPPTQRPRRRTQRCVLPGSSSPCGAREPAG